MLINNEELYTLVDGDNHPVYTYEGMDGHFRKCGSFGDMMSFSKRVGWSQMMELARWSQSHCKPPRIKVFPAKITLGVERIEIE